MIGFTFASKIGVILCMADALACGTTNGIGRPICPFIATLLVSASMPASFSSEPVRSSGSPRTGGAGLIMAISDARFKVGSITGGTPVYTDRNHTVASLPGWIEGGEWLKAPNDYKEKVGEGTLVQFTVTRNAVVYVAFILPRLPSTWPFASTEYRIQMNGRAGMRWYHVWEATLAAGDHALGGINSGGAYGFLNSPVFLFKAGPARIRIPARSSYQIENNTQVGTRLYTDRPYTVVQIPEELKGTTILQTAMEHKKKPHALTHDLWRFCLSEETRVFVATDAGGIPGWLREYTLLPEDQVIVVKFLSNSEKPGVTAAFRLFRKAFPAGAVVKMGYPTDSLGSSKQMYFVAAKDYSEIKRLDNNL